jgi:hypothetical protein
LSLTSSTPWRPIGAYKRYLGKRSPRRRNKWGNNTACRPTSSRSRPCTPSSRSIPARNRSPATTSRSTPGGGQQPGSVLPRSVERYMPTHVPLLRGGIGALESHRHIRKVIFAYSFYLGAVDPAGRGPGFWGGGGSSSTGAQQNRQSLRRGGGGGRRRWFCVLGVAAKAGDRGAREGRGADVSRRPPQPPHRRNGGVCRVQARVSPHHPDLSRRSLSPRKRWSGLHFRKSPLCKALCHALRRNVRIESLTIERCRLRREACQMICDAVAANTTNTCASSPGSTMTPNPSSTGHCGSCCAAPPQD